MGAFSSCSFGSARKSKYGAASMSMSITSANAGYSRRSADRHPADESPLFLPGADSYVGEMGNRWDASATLRFGVVTMSPARPGRAPVPPAATGSVGDVGGVLFILLRKPDRQAGV